MPSQKLLLRKPGEVVPKLKLNTGKAKPFYLELFWESEYSLDAHALLATNAGQGAKVSDFAQVLSVYNCGKINPGGTLRINPDGSFSTPCGSLTHSGDARAGIGEGAGAVITVLPEKIPAEVNEIPIFVTIHNADKAGASFAKVKSAGIRIRTESDGPLGEYELSEEFRPFTAVQVGSLLRAADGTWEYQAIGSGFNGDFDEFVLEQFS